MKIQIQTDSGEILSDCGHPFNREFNSLELMIRCALIYHDNMWFDHHIAHSCAAFGYESVIADNMAAVERFRTDPTVNQINIRSGDNSDLILIR